MKQSELANGASRPCIILVKPLPRFHPTLSPCQSYLKLPAHLLGKNCHHIKSFRNNFKDITTSISRPGWLRHLLRSGWYPPSSNLSNLEPRSSVDSIACRKK